MIKNSGPLRIALLATAAVLMLAAVVVGMARASAPASPVLPHITALAVHPTNPGVRLVSTDASVLLTRDGGISWVQGDLPASWSSPAVSLRYDTVEIATAYALGAFGLGISRDGGETWSVAAPPQGATYLSLEQNPVDGTLYIVAPNGVLRSADAGRSWAALRFPTSLGSLRAVRPDPALSSTLVAATDGGLVLSRDSGLSWLATEGGPAQSVDWLTVLAADDGSLVAYTSAGTCASLDDGVTWQLDSDALNLAATSSVATLSDSERGAVVSWMARSGKAGALSGIPAVESLVAITEAGTSGVGLAATESSLYETLDNGHTWARWDTNLLPKAGAQPAKAVPVALAIAGAALAAAAAYLQRRARRSANAGTVGDAGATPPAPSARTLDAVEVTPTPHLPAVTEVAAPFHTQTVAADTDDESEPAVLVRALCERLGLRILSEAAADGLSGYMVDASGLRLNLPAALPLVLAPSGVAEDSQTQAVRGLAASMGATSPFVIAIDGRADEAETGAAPARTASLPVLTLADVRHVLAAEDAPRAFTGLIESALPLDQLSPFVQSGPVPRAMFYGRDYEIKAVLRALYGKSFAIVGGRKIGKTSFLRQLHQTLQRRPEFVPLYVDCHHVSDDASFLRALALAGQVSVESGSLDVLRRVIMRLRGRENRVEALVVLELDEVDNLLQYDAERGARLMQVFRALSDEGLCHLVLCGERVLDGLLKQDDLPLKGFCGTLHLGYLDQSEALRLVREPLAGLGIAMEDPDAVSARIVALSGRHPNILQAICQQLIERAEHRTDRIVRLEDVAAIQHTSAFRDMFFEVCWGNATTLERLISVLMAPTGQFSADQVILALARLGLHVSPEAVERALAGLQLSSLIVPTRDGYAYGSDAFPEVLRETGFAQGFRESLAETFVEEQQLCDYGALDQTHPAQ